MTPLSNDALETLVTMAMALGRAEQAIADVKIEFERAVRELHRHGPTHGFDRERETG